MAVLVPEDGERSDTTTRDGLVSAVDALAVSLYLADPQVFADFTTWFTGVLTHRGVPATALPAAYRAFDTRLRHIPRARETLTRATAHH
jgi:hypothetical protein